LYAFDLCDSLASATPSNNDSDFDGFTVGVGSCNPPSTWPRS
jgi:hypothetical protein